MKLILIGEEQSKRTEYFLKARGKEPIQFISWATIMEEENLEELLENSVIKMDPPSPNSSKLKDLDFHINQYQALLHKLKLIPNIHFLNTPDAITMVCDKYVSKKLLMDAGIMATPLLEGDFSSHCQLQQVLRRLHIHQVFVKPRFGSGAAGIMAYRLNFRTGQEIAYTTSIFDSGELYNTKHIVKLTDSKQIALLSNAILSQEVVVEKWIPKAAYKGKSYDLRVIYQFGHIEYIVVRRSNGYITNLHLNNDAISVSELSLSQQTLREIDALCHNAMMLFPGLSSAGFDILLHKNTLQPYIIEINAQGDLLYKDIYHKNQIYQKQIQKMSALTDKEV